MLSFRRFLVEYVTLFEFKEWHQYVNQYGQKLLDNTGLEDLYNATYLEPGHKTTQHLTDFLKTQLDIADLPEHHGKWILKGIKEGYLYYTRGSYPPSIFASENDELVADYPKSSIVHLLKKFDELRDKNPRFKLSDINSVVRLHNTILNNDSEYRDSYFGVKKEADYDVVGENEHWTITTPKTFKGACALGHNTSWCTKNEESRFRQYTSAESSHWSGVEDPQVGPLFILTPKNPKRQNEKYQFHMPSTQSKDEINDEINSTTRPDFDQRPLPEISASVHTNYDGRFRVPPRQGANELKLQLHFSDAINGNVKNLENFKKILRDTPFITPHISEYMLKKLKYRGIWGRDLRTDLVKEIINHPSMSAPNVFANQKDHLLHLFRLSDKGIIDETVGDEIARHPNFSDPDHIIEALKSQYASAVLDNPNFNTAHRGSSYSQEEFEEKKFKAMLNSPSTEVKMRALEHPKFGDPNAPEMMGDIDTPGNHFEEMAYNKEITPKLLDHPRFIGSIHEKGIVERILKYGYGNSIIKILKNPRYNDLVENHFSSKVNSRRFIETNHEGSVYDELLQHPAIVNPKDANKSTIGNSILLPLTKSSSMYDRFIIKSSAVNGDSLSQIIRYSTPQRRKELNLFEHPAFKQFSSDHILEVLKGIDYTDEDYHKIMSHENFGTLPQHFYEILRRESASYTSQLAAIKHPKALTFGPDYHEGQMRSHPVLHVATTAYNSQVRREARNISSGLSSEGFYAW